MKKLVLITGASGFVGTHCIVQLIQKGYAVRGTLRSLSRADSIRQIIRENTEGDFDLTFVEADLNGDDGWNKAVEGCDAIFHVASPVPAQLPKHEDELIIPAREGTLRVLRAAKNANVSRVILTSSVAAICYGHEMGKTSFTEEDWTNPNGNNLTPYIKSKVLAEKAAWEFVEKEGGIQLSTVNPGGILGPVLEKDYGTSAEIVKKMMAGEFPGYPNIGFPLVDVRDVASMHILAMETESAIGERFICSNDYIWFSDVGAILKENFPNYAKKIPSRKLPDWLVKVFALFDKETKSVLNELGFRKDVSYAKAQRLLNWSPKSNKEAILATGESLVKFGIV